MALSNNVTKSITYFSVGDEVYYQSQYKAKVLKIDVPVKDDNNKPGALIEFENKDLIPSQMEVPYNTLTTILPAGNLNYTVSSGSTDVFYDVGEDPWCSGKSPDVDVRYNCPSCRKPWKETWIFKKVFYDCVDCNIKREDVFDEKGK